MTDSSLNEIEKGTILFNIFSLGYHDFNGFDSKIAKEIEVKRPDFELLDNNPPGKFKIGLDFSIYEKKSDIFRVGLSLDKNIKNNIHESYFYFKGDISRFDAKCFYQNIKGNLNDLGDNRLFYRRISDLEITLSE